jgi:hypothetical protein
MKVATFIVVDDTLSRNKEEFEFTVNGDVIYPLETPMPVIRKGTGCIGIGYELTDDTMLRAMILQRDKVKKDLCIEHGLKFLAIDVRKPLNTEELKNLLFSVINCN